MTWYRWLAINVALFLATVALFSYSAHLVSAVLGTQYHPIEIAFAPFTLLLFLGPMYAVGFVIYLPTMTLIPRHWADGHRRLAAILLAPLIGAPLWFISPLDLAAVAPYAGLLPVLFGAVVRLVERSQTVT